MNVANVRRGDVYVVDLTVHGGTLTKRRPVVIVQNDRGNMAAPDTIVAAIRDYRGGRLLPILVPVKKGMAGLVKDSVIDAGHIVTLRQDQLGQRIGAIPPEIMSLLAHALRVSLGLETTP